MKSLITALVAFLTFSACSKKPAALPPNPPPQVISAWIAPQIETGSNGLMKLVDVTVKDGQMHEEKGVKSLILNFDYEIEFVRDCRYWEKMLAKETMLFDACDADSAHPTVLDVTSLGRRGEKISFPAKALFILAQGNTWQLFPLQVGATKTK